MDAVWEDLQTPEPLIFCLPRGRLELDQHRRLVREPHDRGS